MGCLLVGLTLASSALAAPAGKGSAPRRDGNSFVFSDGTRVRAVDPSGRAGTVQSDGSIRYSDGTRVTHDPVSGESKIVHPDGSSTRANPNDPRRSGDSYVYGDGVRVRATDPAGKVGQVQGNGSIRYSDGTTVSHDVRSGDTKIVHADGSVEVVTANTPQRQGDYYVWSDGQRAVATDRNGGAGKVSADGTIVFADGSRVSHDVRTGDSKIVHADGRVEVVAGNAPHRTADGFGWSDGASAPGSDPSGNPGKVTDDGWIVYSDGSRVSHDPQSGDSKIVHADGTMTMGNTHTGESKTFAPAQERGLSQPGSDKAPSTGRSNQPGAGSGSGASRTPSSNNNSNNNSSNNSNSNNSNAGKNSSNNSNDKSNNNGSSSTTKDTSSKSTEKVDKEKPTKEKVDKGRQVAGEQTGDKGGTLKPLNLTGQPVPDSSGGGSGSPTNIRVGVGPGARSLQQPAGGAPQLRFNARTLVINPNPVGLTGRGAVTPLDPNGGRR